MKLNEPLLSNIFVKKYVKYMYKACQTSALPDSKNLKQIFPERELRVHSPNFHIQVSVSNLYISTIELPILLQEICGPINRSQPHECGNWD